VTDYKSGKRFGNELKHAQQLQLYALCTLLRHSKIERTTNELWYLDKNELASFELHRSQLSRYLAIFDKRGRALTECEDFKPNPNVVTCKWCPYKGAECQFGVDTETTFTKRNAESFIKRPSKTDDLFKNEDLRRYLQ
jgi:CRISPR/Cas system-associated exonuclease Cas4 (RecB family)